MLTGLTGKSTLILCSNPVSSNSKGVDRVECGVRLLGLVSGGSAIAFFFCLAGACHLSSGRFIVLAFSGVLRWWCFFSFCFMITTCQNASLVIFFYSIQ